MKGRKAPLRLERRDVSAEKPQLTEDGKIVGLAIPFGSWTTIGVGPKSFREQVARGAVTKTLREGDVVYLDNHDVAKPIARKSAGTLTLTPSERGLEYVAEPADTTYAKDLIANVRAGNIRGNSFGFEVVKDSWGYGDDGVEERTLLEIKLPEVSACTFPAYQDTEIGMRDAYKAAMEAREAKATYADLYTCGECGDSGQYGAYCGSCGEPMRNERPDGEFCTHCGAPLKDAEGRSSHTCELRGGDAPGNGKKPYGNVTYADPGYQSDKKKRYPVDTLKHVKAAWAYINKAKNAGKYTSEQLASIKAKIKAAAKKLGVKISCDRSFADFELRGYNPETGFMETRDDPDGKEYAAMHEAIEHLANGDAEAARQALQDCLDSAEDDDGDEDDDAYGSEDSDGKVAHTTPAGSSVPMRTAERVYEILRGLPATAATNEALGLIEPLLAADETSADERNTPKPDTSTSGIALDSDEGIELLRRMKTLKDTYRP